MTLSYDEDIFDDSNRTFLNDNYFSESAYSETMSDENDSFGESFNDVMDLKNNLTLSDGNEDDEFEEVEGDENEDDENLLTNNGTESRLQVSLAFNSGPPVIRWTTKPVNHLDRPSNFSNSFDLIKSINLITALRNSPNGQQANGHQATNRPNNQFNYPMKSTLRPPLRSPADFHGGAKQQQKQQVHSKRSKRQCRHNRKPYNGKRRWQNGRDRSNRRTYPHQYNHFKDGADGADGADDPEERKWEMIERKRSRV